MVNTGSPRLTTSHRWFLHAATIGIALEAEFNRLACTNAVVPAQARCGVRVTAGHGCIPRAGDAVAAAVLPGCCPAGFAAGAAVGYTDRTGKTRAPGV